MCDVLFPGAFLLRNDAEKEKSILTLVWEKKDVTVLTGRSFSYILRAEAILFESVNTAVFKGTEVPLLQLAVQTSYPRHMQPASPGPSIASADITGEQRQQRFTEEMSELTHQLSSIPDDRWREVVMDGDMQALCGHPSVLDFEGTQSIFDAYSGTVIEAVGFNASGSSVQPEVTHTPKKRKANDSGSRDYTSLYTMFVLFLCIYIYIYPYYTCSRRYCVWGFSS